MPERVLLTGGTGYLGGRLARALRSDGRAVSALVRAGSDPARVRALADQGVAVLVHDGTMDGMATLVREAAPSITVHLATRFVASHGSADVEGLCRDNIVFGAQLLEALTTTPGAAVVTAGTSWQQHGNHEYSPTALYAATKQAFDVLATFYCEVRGARVVTCLLPDVYGPADPRPKLIAALQQAHRTGVPLAMGDGAAWMDPLHADDAVGALRVAMDRVHTLPQGVQERWAVRPGLPLTVRELVALYERIHGVELPVEWDVRPPRPREAAEPWTAGAVLPGWHPAVPLADGLARLA